MGLQLWLIIGVLRAAKETLRASQLYPTGSVSLSYDGDRRAAYLLLDESKPAIRRVEYDVDTELKVLSGCGLPHSGWIAKMLESGSFPMP